MTAGLWYEMGRKNLTSDKYLKAHPVLIGKPRKKKKNNGSNGISYL